MTEWKHVKIEGHRTIDGWSYLVDVEGNWTTVFVPDGESNIAPLEEAQKMLMALPPATSRFTPEQIEAIQKLAREL